ncbi:DUF664 domain-containing protein [Rhodococcus rhodnii]|uniref:DUF664 domain-containing protein n=1 Tax=Rhodococcus rhodnii TaxID=38312 RepID=A0A6P2CL14_9NOCA|nr:DinB family protein [Rhodococcus rhodnii]TXG92540.1 DUF664 domain-containing protein [Rhodococcus rhodnii]
MDQLQLLEDAFDRVAQTVHATLDGLPRDALTYHVDPDANTIAWLTWHLTRVQDDHVADAAGDDQIWVTDGWADRFSLPFPLSDIGFGHSSYDVGQVDVAPDLLLGYHDAVHSRTVAYLRTLSGDDLDRVVDTSWDPPVTLGVRLVSVVSDDLQHAGQAAFVAGIGQRTRA